ncbi:MAG: DHH family phosphoesterase [Anaerolineales bacterium]|uniref:DHH family phosphoesterase n=1 Tax=Candidatus Desulfolinea nitratireducens TaxID=2841698 RepID=A0A8J6NLQ9_9CHLR|nr:DHH family phosphoesterase [Candidatus Desulfolinea nitratireducens]MBL6961198.1 DHH family phosphoesterase [Anaerolineales bacterium]
MSKLIIEMNNPINQTHLDKLRSTAGKGPVLILTHDNPDPDSLASGKALATLFREAWDIPSQLVYSGLVARAENQAVLKRLTPEWEHSDILPDLRGYTAVAQVDTQPGAGNNRLNTVHPKHIVIDHHYPVREMIDTVSYADIRTEMGSTVTMLFQYMEASGIQPDPILATAMFYGLKTDTRSLSRGASPADEVAFLELLHYLDQQELAKVELASLSRGYFHALSRGLHATRLFGKVIVARLGLMEQPDFAAEMADILIRLQNTHAALCLGQHEDTLHLSLRTEPMGQNAGNIIQQVIVPPGKAGGHGTMAGGQIPLQGKDMETLLAEIEGHFLIVMGETDSGVELIV